MDVRHVGWMNSVHVYTDKEGLRAIGEQLSFGHSVQVYTAGSSRVGVQQRQGVGVVGDCLLVSRLLITRIAFLLH